MNRIYALIFILLSSCAPKVYSLKGSYPKPPIIYTSNNSLDKVWSNIIDLFAQKGIPIKLVDKSSGLIISEPSALVWSYEDKTGNIMKKDAWVVIPKILDKGANKFIKPTTVLGSWNIRVKEENGKTLINTNLYNITALYSTLNSVVWNTTTGTTKVLDGRSTGNFEKFIFEQIN